VAQILPRFSLLACAKSSDGFTHRPNRSWPRVPRFWSPAQVLFMATHY